MAQYVYTMRRVSKTVPPKRTILKNISLNFFPGAKIGVLGLNGSGKSTLLKIMAGVDDNHDGEVIRMPGIKVGYLEQGPGPGAGKTGRAAGGEAPRGAMPPAVIEARPAASGRADQPSRRRKRRVARAVPEPLSRHGRRRDARSLFSRQRGRLDPGARPRLRHSVGGELLLLARA